jgi:hypothetical protein
MSVTLPDPATRLLNLPPPPVGPPPPLEPSMTQEVHHGREEDIMRR